ncbi:MAG: DUF3488 and transglutaminase-like domain-containing protein [Actinobacteria bacterium]|nr:DUF3488 and transglutaminase-like domain-containing protein [Actinomycetota bacterium]
MRRELALTAATLLVVAAALVSLTRVFSDASWRPLTAAAVLLALAVAAGARQVGFGMLASLVGSLVGLTVFTYVVHLPAGPLLPGPEQLGQAATLFGEGLRQFRDQPAPTVPLDGLLLIITTSVWLVTHATHELLVRWRSAGLGLLVPAVLWVVPLAVPLPPGRTWPQALPFLAAAGLVLLLESDRDVAGFATDRDGVRVPGAGVTVGAFALVVAAVVPGLLPGYGSSSWLDLSGRDDPRGYQPIVDIGDRLKLPTARDVLQVQADRRTYLRLAALDTFDDNTWRLGPPDEPSFRPDASQLFSVDGPLPPETPIAEQSEAFVNVTVLDLANIYVPVPYQPREVLGPDRGDMVYSTVGGFVATGDLAEVQVGGDLRVGVTEGLEYRVRATVPSPGIDQLRQVTPDPAVVAPWLQLPGSYERLGAQAEEVYAAAGATTMVDRAFALQDWFSGPDSRFVYSTDVDVLRGSDALERFVFETRTGYCEYYATAMAVMLRASGIPARVAVGFLPGTLTSPADPATGQDLDTYTVSTTDAHAWVEVLFPGYGWIKFEPTPRSDGATLQPSPQDLDPVMTEREQQLQAFEEQLEGREEDVPVPDTPTTAPTDAPVPDAATDQDAGTGAGEGGLPWGVVAVLLLAGAVTAVIAAGRVRRSSRPDLDAPSRILAAQRYLHASARSYGVGRRPSETTAEVLARWVDEGRIDDERAGRFTLLVQAAAFGGELDEESGGEAEALAAQLAAGLRASVERRDRILAPVRVPVASAASTGRGLLERVRDELRG